MRSVRRWYIYLVAAISLQAVTWVLIELARDLLLARIDRPVSTIALQVAVILVGLPVFLGHWLWAQRLVAGSAEERTATLRSVYLFGMMAGFLLPLLYATFELAGSLLGQAAYLGFRSAGRATIGEALVYYLVPLLILGVFWLYHRRILAISHPGGPTGRSAVVRRFYIYGLTTVGLVLTTQGVVALIQWIGTRLTSALADSIVSGSSLPRFALQSLIVGLPLWLLAWRRAQALFGDGGVEEAASALRKFFLYLAVFLGVIMVVTSATTILASLLQRVLGVPTRGDIWVPLSQIVGLGLVWLYHGVVLRRDEAIAAEKPRQAAIRRIYLYLVAGVGLAALLVGLGGVISVLLRGLDTSFGADLRTEAAWFISAISAGLPVWLLPWRRIQQQAAAESATAMSERQSLIRRIYLYFYLFVAAMTLLSSLIYIVSRVVQTVLGMTAPTLAQLGQAIAYGLLAVAVWVLHFWLLRGDSRAADEREAAQLAAAHLVVIGAADSPFQARLLQQLAARMPALPVTLCDLAAGTEGAALSGQLAQATLIVAPSGALLPSEDSAFGQAIAASTAPKLIVPQATPQWAWAGLAPGTLDDLVASTMDRIAHLASGDAGETGRSLGVGAIIAIVVGLLILLFITASGLINLFF